MASQAPATGSPGSFRLNVGTAPVNWNNFDLPNWRPVVPFPAILDEMLVAGFDATEWDLSFGAQTEVLNRERMTRGMIFTGAYRWLDFVDSGRFRNDLVELTPFLKTLQEIGADHLIVADRLRPDRVACAGAVPADGSRSLDLPGYRTIAHHLSELAEVSKEHGLAVHYHNHAGTVIETLGELALLIDHLEPGTVDLCFDTGHFAYGGGDSLDFLRNHLPAIGYLHLKDVDANVLHDARTNGWSFTEGLRHFIFCPLGEGSAHIDSIVTTLAGQQFSGYVIVEQDTCRGDSTANARHNLETVRQIEAAHGGT